MTVRDLTLSMAVLCGGLTLTAQSEQELTSQLEEIILSDQIQAAGKKMQDSATAPADVVVLRSDQLKALGYRTLGDVLGGVVGFRTNEDHAYQGLAVRGLYILGDQNTRFLVLLDGHALNSPAEIGSSKVGEDFGVTLEGVDRIEIVRGPASSLYGNNAFLALINVVTADAAAGKKVSLQAGLTGGSGQLADLWLDGGLQFGGIQASLMASGFQRKGYSRSYPQLNDVHPALPGVSLDAGSDREERQSAYLRLKGSDWAFGGAMVSRTQRLASGPFGSLPGDSGNRYGNRRLSGDLKWEPRWDSVRCLFRLFGDRNEFTDAFMADPLRSNYQQWDACPDWSLGVELQARLQLHDRFSMTLGTERRDHRCKSHTLVAGSDNTSETREDIDYQIGNSYLEATWQMTKALTLVSGLQGAEWRPSRAEVLVDGTSVPVARSSIRRLTPRDTLIWEIGPKDVVKAIYGQGFRFPTIFERYYTDNVFFFNNENLKPEVITVGQLVWNHRWNSRVRCQVSGSLMQWEKLITPGLMPGMDEAQQYQNALADIRGKAVEGEWGYQDRQLEFDFGLGWYEWKQNGVLLDNVSRWNGYFKVIQRLGALSLAGEARYVDGREAGGLTTTRVKANWTLRASARYEIRPGFLQLSLEDLLSSRREDLVAKDYEPITWMRSEGFQARLTLGWRFW